MADPLLLRLPRTPQQHATWLVLGAAPGERSPESGPLSLAASRAAGRPVIVLVPGADVLLMQPQLPAGRSGAKLQQLVPYALEEQLAEDIDALHFAIGRRSGARTPVAVVARRKMDEWLAGLRSSGIEPAALHADSQLLPDNPTQAVALLEDDSVTVRTPSGTVTLLPVDTLGEALESHPPQALPEVASQGLILYAGQDQWERHAGSVEALRERLEGIQVQLLGSDPLLLFAQQLSKGSPINLLQGPYASRGTLGSGWRAWRVAAGLLGALIVLHLAGQGTELIVLRQRDRQLDAAIGQVFHAAMPGTQGTQEARRRMAQRLKQIRASEAEGGFLTALGTLARARAAVPGTQFEAMSFRSGVLDLKLSAPTVDGLDRLTRSLGQQGWQAHLVSGTPQGSRFEGDIRLSRGS